MLNDRFYSNMRSMIPLYGFKGFHHANNNGKDNVSDSIKIRLIDKLVQKNDKCPILFTNGTFMSCLKAILELDKNNNVDNRDISKQKQ